MSGSYPWDNNQPSKISICPNGKVVALSHDKSLAFYSVVTGLSAGAVPDVHTEPVTQVLFSAASDLVFTSGDRHVRVFHNVPGLRISIQVSSTVHSPPLTSTHHTQDLTLALQKNLTNSAAKERIEKQIESAEAALKAIEG